MWTPEELRSYEERRAAELGVTLEAFDYARADRVADRVEKAAACHTPAERRAISGALRGLNAELDSVCLVLQIRMVLGVDDAEAARLARSSAPRT